jgi:hypothetical protein
LSDCCLAGLRLAETAADRSLRVAPDERVSVRNTCGRSMDETYISVVKLGVGLSHAGSAEKGRACRLLASAC